MVDSALVPAIREAVKQNEIGSASPYALSYARLGQSGASFGFFQGDTNVNQLARSALTQILQAGGADAGTVGRIMAAVSQPCPNGNPLSGADTGLANGALSSDTGRQLVDAMDTTLLDVVLGELDSCIDAASAVGQSIDPEALLYIALWANMTGAPSTLDKWLGGTPELGLGSPAGPVVTPRDLTGYLQATSYFQQHARNFTHMQSSVAAAVPLLPAV